MNQGEVWLCFPPSDTRGHEQKGVRPYVILSNTEWNKEFLLVTVSPTTTSKMKYHGWDSCVPIDFGGDKKACVLTDRLCSFSHKRLLKRVGKISERELNWITHKRNKIFKRDEK